MGNSSSLEKIPVNIKIREYKIIPFNIPYKQLEMIKVLQGKFDYEVKGTIYVDHDHKFKSFEVRTDSSEIFSYGSADWRVSFHTHPDNTAQKYGIRYFSPPSVDDVMEIYEHSVEYVPETVAGSFGEISIIFANEGIYVLQVDRESFQKYNYENLPTEALNILLEETLTEFMVSNVKKGIKETINKRHENKDKNIVIDMDNPDISYEEYIKILKKLVKLVTKDFGFNMQYHSWIELKEKGLTLKVFDYFLNNKVND